MEEILKTKTTGTLELQRSATKVEVNAVWGNIKGDIKLQQDLQKELAEIKESIPASLDGGNAATVNNHTVESDVPSNAKFTDTVYNDEEVKNDINHLKENKQNTLVSGENIKTINGKELTGSGDVHINEIEVGSTVPQDEETEMWIDMSKDPEGIDIVEEAPVNNSIYARTKGYWTDITQEINDVKRLVIEVADLKSKLQEILNK